MSMSTLADIPRNHGRDIGDKPALVYQGQTVTYGEMDHASNQVAQGLAAQGVGPGDRIAFLDKNTPEYFSYLFGGAKVNAVSVAVNWRLAPKEMLYILNDSEARVLLIGAEFLGYLAEIEAELKHIKKVVVIGDSDEHENFEQWISQYEAVDPLTPSAGTDVCYQLYTSGTTGLPKGVELTNNNMFDMLPVASKEWTIDSSTVNIVCMPLFHIAGSGWGVAGLFNGAKNIMLRDVDPVEILKLIPEYKITVALFVPAVLQFMLQIPGVEDVDFSSLKTIIYGASPITNEVLISAMETFGCNFIQVYGLTETTGAVTVLRPEDHDPGGPRDELLRSAGKPWGDVKIRIVDTETGRDLPDGQVGEIWIETKQNMKGYWKQEKATAEVFPEGNWFCSGDAGFLKDGFLYIHDRVKDMIISGGENIYPAEIENVLMAHDEVADAAVIGIPDKKWGETVKAVIVKAEGSDVTEAEIIGVCRQNLAHYKCPTSIDWVDAIPRNPSGKILKTELRKPYWKDQDRQVS